MEYKIDDKVKSSGLLERSEKKKKIEGEEQEKEK